MNIQATGGSDRLVVSVPMEPFYTARRHLYKAGHFLDHAEARDKICRAIQFTSKIISNGKGGVAHNVDVSTALARKVFRLLKSINELEYLLAPIAKAEDLPIVFLNKSMHGLMATYFLLDNLVWAGMIGFYKNRRLAQFLSDFSLYFFIGGCACSSLVELIDLVSKKKDAKHSVTAQMDRVMHQGQKLERDTSMCLMRLARSSLDVVVGIGLLGLTPKVTPRTVGVCGTLASLIACYEIYQTQMSKVKNH